MPVHDFDRIINRRGGDSIKWNTYPDDVLPMWVADSDFTTAEPIAAALKARVEHGVFGYSDMNPEMLQKAVAHWMRTRFAWQADPAWAAFSPSVVISLALAVNTFTNPGDSTLFLSPSYPPFFGISRNHGRRPVTSPLTMKNGRYEIDFADLEEKMSGERTRLFILCNPHNPTGRVFSLDELKEIGRLCLKHDLLIVSDEIHCDYVFPDRRHIPFASLSKELSLRTLTAINPSKTFNVADLHASAVICENPELLSKFLAAAQNMALHSSALGVLALKTAYMECAWYADQVAAYVKRNIDFAVPYINGKIPGIKACTPESTCLLWLDCRDLGLSQKDLEKLFLEKARLALNSGTDFGREGEGFMRMNLACPRATVQEGLNRLEQLVK